MKSLYYLKWPLIVFLLGFLTRFIGVLFKLRHWPGADELITIGSIICGIAIVFGIIKIAVIKKSDE